MATSSSDVSRVSCAAMPWMASSCRVQIEALVRGPLVIT